MESIKIRNPSELPMFLTVLEMANLLGISRSSAYQLTAKEGFPKIRVVAGRIIIPRDKLLMWLDEQTNCGKIG